MMLLKYRSGFSLRPGDVVILCVGVGLLVMAALSF